RGVRDVGHGGRGRGHAGHDAAAGAVDLQPRVLPAAPGPGDRADRGGGDEHAAGRGVRGADGRADRPRLRQPDRRGERADARARRRRRHHHPAGTVAAPVRRARPWRRHLGGRTRRPRGLLGESGTVEHGRHRFRPPPRHVVTRQNTERSAMSLEERFGTAKPVIAMVHFPGLPGRPRHDRDAGRNRLLDVVGRDLEVLQYAGVDALLFCNENDIPYQLAVGPEIPAAMAAVIGELHPRIRVPFGVNVLWDARASGAVFIREVLTGVYESDMGMIAPSLGDLAAYRDAIGASDVALFGNITPEFSSTLGTRTVAERARSASFLGLDVILISGPEAGVPFAMSDLRAAKQAAPQTPVLANTG